MTTAEKPQSAAWFCVLLLFPVALLNYLDRQMLATMKTSVMHDIPSIINQENWGMLLGMFKWTYAIVSLFVGIIALRVGHVRLIAISLFVWSLTTWATGHCQTYHQLLIVRGLMGFSEACYIPTALAFIATIHMGDSRSKAVGLHQIGIYTGVILGAFSGYAADVPQLGWRGAFSVAGYIGIIYAIPLYFLLGKYSRRLVTQKKDGELSDNGSGFQGLLQWSFVLMILYFTLPALAGWVIRDWMPAIIKTRFNMSQGAAGVNAVLYFQCAAIASAMLGGWIADRWVKRNIRGRIYTSAIGMSLLVPALIAVGIATGEGSSMPMSTALSLCIGGLILFGCGWGFFDCNNMPILCQIMPASSRATAYGILNFFSISCGGLADWLFGVLKDRHISNETIFTIFGLISVISVVLILFVRPRTATSSLHS